MSESIISSSSRSCSSLICAARFDHFSSRASAPRRAAGLAVSSLLRAIAKPFPYLFGLILTRRALTLPDRAQVATEALRKTYKRGTEGRLRFQPMPQRLMLADTNLPVASPAAPAREPPVIRTSGNSSTKSRRHRPDLAVGKDASPSCNGCTSPRKWREPGGASGPIFGSPKPPPRASWLRLWPEREGTALPRLCCLDEGVSEYPLVQV